MARNGIYTYVQNTDILRQSSHVSCCVKIVSTRLCYALSRAYPNNLYAHGRISSAVILHKSVMHSLHDTEMYFMCHVMLALYVTSHIRTLMHTRAYKHTHDYTHACMHACTHARTHPPPLPPPPRHRCLAVAVVVTSLYRTHFQKIINNTLHYGRC